MALISSLDIILMTLWSGLKSEVISAPWAHGQRGLAPSIKTTGMDSSHSSELLQFHDEVPCASLGLPRSLSGQWDHQVSVGSQRVDGLSCALSVRAPARLSAAASPAEVLGGTLVGSQDGHPHLSILLLHGGTFSGSP